MKCINPVLHEQRDCDPPLIMNIDCGKCGPCVMAIETIRREIQIHIRPNEQPLAYCGIVPKNSREDWAHVFNRSMSSVHEAENICDECLRVREVTMRLEPNTHTCSNNCIKPAILGEHLCANCYRESRGRK